MLHHLHVVELLGLRPKESNDNIMQVYKIDVFKV